ncbi:MAG: NAD-dependent deacylase [Roseibium sp.]|uniref:NAD-dependent deacylase n=1 Tax=Roseibium sp. TaxID=1936156 RepID=UPI003296D8F4
MIFILTGSGISAESGIRTYRSDTGLWEEHAIAEVATLDGFRRDQDAVRAFYDARLEDCLKAEPNAAHLALARLERESDLPVVIVTQNVDDLHERAGSTNVIHMHGSLGTSLCAWCGKRAAGDFPHRLLEAPKCASCGSGMRPNIVWFGETPMHLEKIQEHLRAATLFLSIGTSGEVHPAARFVRWAKKPKSNKARCIEVNLRRTEISNDFREERRGPATQVVPKLVDELLAG